LPSCSLFSPLRKREKKKKGKVENIILKLFRRPKKKEKSTNIDLQS